MSTYDQKIYEAIGMDPIKTIIIPPHAVAIKTHVSEHNKWKLNVCKCGTPISWTKHDPFIRGCIDIDYKLQPWLSPGLCKLCNVGVLKAKDFRVEFEGDEAFSNCQKVLLARRQYKRKHGKIPTPIPEHNELDGVDDILEMIRIGLISDPNNMLERRAIITN